MAHRTTSKPSPSPVGDPSFASIRSLAATLHDLHRQKAAALAPAAQHLIRTRSHDISEIEHTLNHLLDCACLPEGLALFKSLCRHYYGINPANTASYIYAYREMWDTEAELALPPAEDVKKVERRLTSEEKKSLKKLDVLKDRNT